MRAPCILCALAGKDVPFRLIFDIFPFHIPLFPAIIGALGFTFSIDMEKRSLVLEIGIQGNIAS
jgi:hypothetical protein